MTEEKLATLERDGLCIGISLAFGPRISFLRFGDSPNLMVRLAGPSNPDEHAVYGGHRVWAAPEHPVSSYWPDNQPPIIDIVNAHSISAWNEDASDFRRIMRVEMLAGGACRVHNEVVNLTEQAREMASWGITSLIPGGTGIMPFGSGSAGLNPDRNLVYWPYTAVNDPAINTMGPVLTVQQPNLAGKFKIGSWHAHAWLAYAIGDWLFVKRSEARASGTYPDLGSNLEIYGDPEMLELETLSPLQLVPPGGSVKHEEIWWVKQLEPTADQNQRMDQALGLIKTCLAR